MAVGYEKKPVLATLGWDMDMEIKDAIDMSEDEKTYGGGNCYVVPKATEEGTRFSFDATKEGRTDDPVGTVVKTGKSASGAKLVAEDTEGLIADITYENGDIIVTPEVNKTGNAIVAVTDEDGTILWSWHLWVVEDNSFMTDEITKGTTIIISHQERILEIADEIILMKSGKIQKIGTSEEILNEEVKGKGCCRIKKEC